MNRKQVALDAALANRLQHYANTEGTNLQDFTRKLLLWAMPHYHTASSLWLLKHAEVIVPKLTLPKKAEEAMKAQKRKYPGVKGKIVKYAETFEEDGEVYIGIPFTDSTHLFFVVSPQTPRISTAQLLKWKEGESSVIRLYSTRVRNG